MFIYPAKHLNEGSVSDYGRSETPTGSVKPSFIPQSANTTAASRVGNLRGEIAVPNMLFRALSKMTLGATPELINHVESLSGANDQAKIFAYIDEQLEPLSIVDSEVDEKLSNGFVTLNKSRQQLYQDHIRPPDGSNVDWEYRRLPHRETHYATFVRGIYSKRQLNELMVDFWHNHFNVYVQTTDIRGIWVNYDRIMRDNSLGNFRVMLQQMTQSMCMLEYLGNGVNEKDAPNENFARELLELHTIGADNYFGHMDWNAVPTDSQGRRIGYVEADVLELARALTGWSYDGATYQDRMNPTTGLFIYRDAWHDKGIKRVMGQNFSFNASSPLSDVEDILDMLCEHPATAGFLAKKLCKRFISDNPPSSIVNQVADVLHANWQSVDQIKLGMEVLLKSSAFLNTWSEKIKRPFERSVGAMRQMAYEFDFNPDDLRTAWHFNAYEESGQNLFFWVSPDGYPDEKGHWLGASSLMMTWRFIQWVATIKDAGEVTYSRIVEQTLAAFPNNAERTPNNLVNYWFQRICGVEANAHTQDKLAEFMSYEIQGGGVQATDRDAPVDLTGNNTSQQEKLRAMVSMICMTTEFNYR